MKTYLFTAIVSFLMFTGCNNSSETNTTKAGDENITETALPKGKYIIDDDDNTAAPVHNTISDPESANGFHFKKNNNGPKTATDPATSAENLKRRYKNLLVFHAKDTMKIKKAYIASLVLGKDQILADLKDEVLTTSGGAPDDKIKLDTTLEIGTRMRAKLVDMSGASNKGFDIELIGGEDGAEQNITDTRKKAIWQWKLTPLTPGQQELTLAISVIEKNGDRVTLPTRNIPVLIFAEKQSFLSQVGDFFTDTNSKWLITAICIPILIAWFTTRMRHIHDIRAAQARASATADQHKAPATTDGTAVAQPTGNPETNKST